MNNEEMTESLLDTICYVIDILPTRIQEFGKYSEIEEYYLQKQELEKFTEKMVIANLSMLANAEGLFMRRAEN